MTKLRCQECQKNYTIEDVDLNFECVEVDPDRGMGPENTYSGEISFDCEGNGCNNTIRAEFTFWEYPAMVVNHSESKTEGCDIVEHPDYQSLLTESDFGED